MENLIVRQIVNIDENTQNTIIDWMYNWWGKEEGYSLDEVRCYINHSCNKDKLPQTYGLFLDDKIVGMYQFTYSDLDIRPDIYPWLANFYISEEYRNHGYSKILLNSVKENASKCNFKELYLFTKHVGLYEKYNFEYIEELDTFKKSPRMQRLYKLDLNK